jgi:hypothetical protein
MRIPYAGRDEQKPLPERVSEKPDALPSTHFFSAVKVGSNMPAARRHRDTCPYR